MKVWNKPQLSTVISGGQCGVDQGALVAARLKGLSTGGIAPKNYRTYFGECPLLQSFGLTEDSSYNYAPRTKKNIFAADFTLVIAFDFTSAGTALTTKLCRELNKPYYAIPLIAADTETKFLNYVADQVGFALPFITGLPLRTLNVAGNRDTRGSTRMFDVTQRILADIFTRLEELDLIVSSTTSR